MAQIIIRHRVADYDTWERAFLAHAAARREFGFTGHTILRDESDPNLVTCVNRVRDLARAKAFIAQPELRDAMRAAGVQGPPEFLFCVEADEQAY